MQDRLDEADAHLQKALKLKPNYPDAKDNLDKILSMQKHR